ncbi:hypothetical protein [Enhygromyxa salina]|uniref:hypothetical protein n=1 Tax=Enhygromyxa salina TaxID=215803 RepID=UPI0011B1C82F|nr:hypothetical protein [Enhygromyxa salina]
MSRIVYGIYPNREAAEAAKRTLQTAATHRDREHEVATAAIHEHEIRPEDLPPAGRSVREAGLIGGVFVALCVALVLGLLRSGAFAGVGGPDALLGVSLGGVLVVSLVAGVFGGVVSGLGGSAENRAEFRRLENAVATGSVLLTIETTRERVRKLARAMKRNGARRTGSI